MLKHKKRIWIVLFVIIVVLMSILVIKISLESNQKKTESFYNEGMLISLKVFMRINALPMEEDELEDYRKEIDGYYDDFKALETTSNTADGEAQLEKLFENAYEMLSLMEQVSLENPDVNSYDRFELMVQNQEIYLEYASLLDKKNIPVFESTVSNVQEITFDFLEQQKERWRSYDQNP